METKQVFEGTGTVESKEEGITKKDKEYWKFQITLNGEDTAKTFGLFEYDAGIVIKKNMKVYMYWTESKGTSKFGTEITYRKLTSIFEIDPHKLDEEDVSGENGVAPAITNYNTEHKIPIQKDMAKVETYQKKQDTYQDGMRFGMMVNNTVQLCIAEHKTSDESIEARFNSFKALVAKLEGR